MITLLRREFTVNLGREQAWQHLASIEQWPSWARHIRKIELKPPGELKLQSTGLIHLTNGMKPAFQVTEFDPPHNWKWVGQFLWLTVIYDHQFEVLDAERCQVIFIIEGQGFGARILGPLFARIYRQSLDRAIPLLVREMNRQAGRDCA